MDLTAVHQFFKENLGISLRDEWVNEAAEYLRQNEEFVARNDLITAIFEQWLHTNIKVSSQPSSCRFIDKSAKNTIISDKIVMQVESLIDISTSLYSQYRNLTYKFEDNSGFQSETNINEVDNEYTSKVLLCGNICCRRGILFLTESNCVVLGGDDEELMKINRPVEILSRRLAIITTKPKEIPVTSNNKALAAGQTRLESRSSNSQRATMMMNNSCTKKEIRDTKGVEMNLNNSEGGISRLDAVMPANRQMPFLTQKKPVMEVKPLSDEDIQLMPTISKLPRIPATQLPSANAGFLQQSCRKTAKENSRNSVDRKPIVDDFDGKLSAMSVAQRAKNKNIKTEVSNAGTRVSLINDEEQLNDVKKQQNTQLPSETYLKRNSNADEMSKIPCVAAFIELRIAFIADALKSMRFAVGSKRKFVAAVMESTPVEPLRIADNDVWAMMIELTDESYSCLKCIVSHSLLVELIGLSPAEAQAIRSSKDATRKKEGTLRLKSVEESMRRLDLIWEIEFFAPGGSTPIAHKLETYAQKLGMLS